MDQKMTPMDRLEALANVLDKLADLPGGGRTKCGLIWVANDVLNGLQKDILILEEKAKSTEQTASDSPDVKLEVVPAAEEENNE